MPSRDALGAPVEVMSIDQIHNHFWPGTRDFAPAYGRVGAITDDTQMALFTAGVICAVVREGWRGVCHAPAAIHRAYVRCLTTQGYDAPKLECQIETDDEWLREYNQERPHSGKVLLWKNTCADFSRRQASIG
jgi:hypothetical protein